MIKKEVQSQYPRDVWVLTKAYVVKKVTVVASRRFWGSRDGVQSKYGKAYLLSEIHESKAEAIQHGRAEVAKRRAYLEQQSTMLDKRAAKLDKAEASQNLK